LGGESVGLVVTVEMDAADVELDPFEAVRESGQYLVLRDVAPAELVELREIGWSWPLVSWTRTTALADWAAMERAREDGLDVWQPPKMMADVFDATNRDLARLRSGSPDLQI
jgi:hypothetical protein